MRQVGVVMAAASGADPVYDLVQYGVLGVVAALLIMYTRSSIARERQKADAAEAQVRELNNFIRDDLLPRQVEGTILHRQVAEVLEEAIKLISEMKIRDNIRRQDRPYPPESPEGGGPRG